MTTNVKTYARPHHFTFADALTYAADADRRDPDWRFVVEVEGDFATVSVWDGREFIGYL